MASVRITTEKFLELAGSIPVIDVRSPSEYSSGHIPGAVNIPLFNDAERETVGTLYKKKGRIPAIMAGLDLTAPTMSLKLKNAISTAADGKLLVYCWRGGMRSETMAWLFSLGDLENMVLEGGYKAYRNYILDRLGEKRKMIVLGGLTGSSKTHIIRHLKNAGEQVIDLEQLANHKGSAFGGLGQPPQPTTEQFANLLFAEFELADPGQPFWVEDESRNIGTVFIPDSFYFNMQEAPAIILMLNMKLRLPRLIEEYSGYPSEILADSIRRISKRLGGDNTRDAIDAVEKGNHARAIEIALTYYDKAYQYGLKRKNHSRVIYVESDSDDIEDNATRVLEAAKKINW